MSSKTDTAKSVEMHQVVGAILKNITKAREISDRYSNYVGEGYRPKLTDEGSIENENQLISYSVPRAEISDVNVNLKFAIDKVEEAQDADEANQFFFNTIIEKYLDTLTDAYLNTVKTVENFSTQQLQSYQINIRDSIAQWIQYTFICEISEERKNLQIQIKKEKESIKKTIIEDFTNHLKKIPIPLVNIFDILNKKKQFTVEEIVNLYKKNAGVFKEHLEIERPELLAANNTDSGEVNLKFKDPKIKESIILKKDKSKWEEKIDSSWKKQEADSHLYRVDYGNGMWVVVGGNGTILTSNDGKSWTKQKINTKQTIYGVAYGNGMWIVVCDDGSIFKSSNGTSWEKIPTVFRKVERRVINRGLGMKFSKTIIIGTTGFLRRVAYGNGIWVAVGNNDIFTSSNGTSWTKRTTDIKGAYGAAYGNGIWIAVSSNGQILRSSNNGVSWTQIINVGTLYGVAYGNGMWVAVGNRGAIFTSNDGKSWTKRSIPLRGWLYGIKYGDGIWIATGNYGEILMSKNNGISWIKDTSRVNVWLNEASYANDIWTVVGDKNILTSGSVGNIREVKSFVNELYELEKKAIDSRQQSILTKIQDNLKNDEVIKESIEKIPTEKMLFKKDDQLMIQVELEELKKRERVSEINFKTNIKNHKWLRGEKGMFNLIPEE